MIQAPSVPPKKHIHTLSQPKQVWGQWVIVNTDPATGAFNTIPAGRAVVAIAHLHLGMCVCMCW